MLLLALTTCPSCHNAYNIEVSGGSTVFRDVKNFCPSCGSNNTSQIFVTGENAKPVNLDRVVEKLLNRLREEKFSVTEARRFAQFIEAKRPEDTSLRGLEKTAANINPKFGRVIHSFRRYGKVLGIILTVSVFVLRSCSFNVTVDLNVAQTIAAWKGQAVAISQGPTPEESLTEREVQNSHSDQSRSNPDPSSHRSNREGKDIPHIRSPSKKSNQH